jgi:tetratricopeptide (TPR) repeat protein
MADLNQAIRLNPNFAEAYFLRGSAYGSRGDYARASADLEKALQLNPNHAGARNGLEILRGMGY